ncbi:MAG: SusC/RagA family TonB-linked outer membrane protein, partial [Sphingobacterium sp.]
MFTKNWLRYLLVPLVCCWSTIYAQELLHGTVQDLSQSPIVGASINVVGHSDRATSSDTNGAFVIAVKLGETLQFTSVEYQTQTFKVASMQPITITLQAQDELLDEVVVIGYGSQRRSNLVAPVSKFNAEGLEERPVARVDQALVGQMSGVRVKQTTGIPGKGMSVQVRGSGSITAGSEPLYVVDGFPLNTEGPNGSGNYSSGNPLDNMNPSDIASVEVLKDASAAAIYGSRAANGVVLITTKRGKSGEAKINFNTYVGSSKAYKTLDMLSPTEWMDRSIEMTNAQWVASGSGRTASQTVDERRDILGLAPGTYNTTYMYDERWDQQGYPGLYLIDWQDEVYRNGLVQNYQLAASGGTDHVNYYVSGNYMDQKAIVKGIDYKNYSMRANVDVKANDKITLGMNLAPTYSIQNDPGTEGKDNIMHQVYSMSPVQEQPAGLVNVFENDKYPWSTSTNDPLAKLTNNIGENKTTRILATVYGSYKILDNLTFKTTVNYDHTDRNAFSFRPYTIGSTLENRLRKPNEATYGADNKFT